MSESPSPTSSYTMGYSDEFQQLLDRRSADTHAFYQLPHLKSGQRVLDFGCGPQAVRHHCQPQVDYRLLLLGAHRE